MTDNHTTEPNPVCECCGEPATTMDVDGVPLCDADYAHLLEHWSQLSEEEKRNG